MNVFMEAARQTTTNLISKTKPFTSILHVVLGNETCDLDSAMSAILYAWLMYKKQKSTPRTVHCIPVFNITKNLFRLRTETMYLMKKLNISTENVVFRDDLEKLLTPNSNFNDLKISLVDHHILSESLQFIQSNIVGVVDHRPLTATFDSLETFVVHPVGSCVTLIAELMLSALDAGEIQVEDEEWGDIVHMIAGPILLDTVNLSESAGKVTKRDLDVIQRVWKRSKFELTEFFEELTAAKFNSTNLSARDLLLKDMKLVVSSSGDRKVMFSTIHDSYSNFWKRPDAFPSVSDVVIQQNCDAWVALFPQQKRDTVEPYKPLMLYSADDLLLSRMKESITTADDPDLRLQISSEVAPLYCNFRMHNVKASRKQILPIIVKLID